MGLPGIHASYSNGSLGGSLKDWFTDEQFNSEKEAAKRVLDLLKAHSREIQAVENALIQFFESH